MYLDILISRYFDWSLTLLLFSYFLPPESGERITIVITVLLAFTVILHVLNQSIPDNADCAPVLLIFYLVVMGESTMSLFTTCMVLVGMRQKKSNDFH